ncbi:Chymotrypsin-like elastase family member [Trichinella pseudospiralis]
MSSRIYKYFNPETTWYQRSDRKQYNKRVVSATKAGGNKDQSTISTEYERRMSEAVTCSGRNQNLTECQKQ